MIVEPVPTNPRSPIRRGLRLIGTAVPLVLLVGVVAAGSLGPQSEAADRSPESAADRSPEASATRDVRPAPTSAPIDAAGNPVTFPETWIGFRVRGVADTQAERVEQAATGTGGIVAVSGFLSYGSLPWTCVDAYLDLDEGACRGRALLADRAVLPTSTDGTSYADVGPHLHPVFPPGVRGPAPDDRPGSNRGEPIPVVVLGSFDAAPGDCPPGARRCGEGFVVERVVWVAGAPWGPTLTIDPALRVEPNIPEIQEAVDVAVTALGRGSLALVTAVVRPAALAGVDGIAAEALPEIPDERQQRPVTYVRGLQFQFDSSQPLYGRDPSVGWVVLDSISGELLARSGPAGGRAP